jgi:hypothetical protein
MSAFSHLLAKTAFGGENPLSLPLILLASVLSAIPP